MLNLLDEDGIVHGHAYEQECIALNDLGEEIGHLAMYQNGYYHKYDQGKSEDLYKFRSRTNINVNEAHKLNLCDILF